MWTEKLKLSDKITLQITPAWISDYCQEIQRSTATSEKRLVALDALLTFISAAVDPVFLKDEAYEHIKKMLSAEVEGARRELMEERSLLLYRAFELQDVAKIAFIFNSLSRGGFWDLLTQTMSRMDEGLRKELSAWAIRWLDETTSRGEQASPYPDTIDFVSAGIDISEYTAMTDLCKYIDSQ